MYYLDYAKKVDDRYILNFFADSAEDLKDVPTDKPYITRNGTNYGIPLDTSVVTIIEEGTKVNYVLQNGAYIAGGDVPATPTEEKTVVLALADGDQVITPTDGKNISKVTITKPVELLPENIKKGITIAGVTGTYEAATIAE